MGGVLDQAKGVVVHLYRGDSRGRHRRGGSSGSHSKGRNRKNMKGMAKEDINHHISNEDYTF